MSDSKPLKHNDDLLKVVMIKADALLAEMFPLAEQRDQVQWRRDAVVLALSSLGVPNDQTTRDTFEYLVRLFDQNEKLITEAQEKQNGTTTEHA